MTAEKRSPSERRAEELHAIIGEARDALHRAHGRIATWRETDEKTGQPLSPFLQGMCATMPSAIFIAATGIDALQQVVANVEGQVAMADSAVRLARPGDG